MITDYSVATDSQIRKEIKIGRIFLNRFAILLIYLLSFEIYNP